MGPKIIVAVGIIMIIIGISQQVKQRNLSSEQKSSWGIPMAGLGVIVLAYGIYFHY